MAQCGRRGVRFLFFALFQRGTHLPGLHATPVPLLSQVSLQAGAALARCCPSTKKCGHGGGRGCPSLPRRSPEQPAVPVALVLLGAGSGQRPPHLPSPSHTPSQRASYGDAGTPRGQRDRWGTPASGRPRLAPVARAAGMLHSSGPWRPAKCFQAGSTSHLQLPFKNLKKPNQPQTKITSYFHMLA